METLYKQVDFILSGGALRFFTDFMQTKVEKALIVEASQSNLDILDAINTKTEDFILPGQAAVLAQAFPSHTLTGKFDISATSAPMQGEWPWAVRLRGSRWTIYILLQEAFDSSLLDELTPYAGLIDLWQSFQKIAATEERLSRLAYMILTTKSTLASIFEPLPIDFFAKLLLDVLRESLFPRSVSIYQDDGHALSFLAGDGRETPLREGIYAQKILPTTSVVTAKTLFTCEVVLPISEGGHRIFCVTEWAAQPNEETLNFMELLGSLGARALSLHFLRSESSRVQSSASSGNFAMISLASMLSVLQQEMQYARFLSLAADAFWELSLAPECFLVIWDRAQKAYVPAVYLKNGINASFDPVPLPVADASVNSVSTEAFYDLKKIELSELYRKLNMADGMWPEMRRMRYLFPLADKCMEGFIAVSSGVLSSFDDGTLAALQIVSRFAAFEMQRFAASMN